MRLVLVNTYDLGRQPFGVASPAAWLRRAGAIVVAKTNMHEWAYGATNKGSHHGPTRNPWDPRAITGGSSGGSAACVADGLLPLSQPATLARFRIAYHDYEGPALNLDERARLVADLGDREAMILRNHGLLTVGPSIPECFNNMFRLERSCQLQVMTLSCNSEITLPPAEVVKATQDGFKPGVRRRWGLTEWPALLRKLDRIDPSYRD